jgi:hypothetical protein
MTDYHCPNCLSTVTHDANGQRFIIHNNDAQLYTPPHIYDTLLAASKDNMCIVCYVGDNGGTMDILKKIGAFNAWANARIAIDDKPAQ